MTQIGGTYFQISNFEIQKKHRGPKEKRLKKNRIISQVNNNVRHKCTILLTQKHMYCSIGILKLVIQLLEADINVRIKKSTSVKPTKH